MADSSVPRPADEGRSEAKDLGATGAQQIRHALGELNSALATTANVDPEARRLLEQTLHQIRALLDRGASAGETAPSGATSHASVAGQLAGAGRHFEETHPTLAGLVQSVVDALAQMGI